MPPVKKSSAPLVLGILSVIFSFLIPIVGLILGIIGLSLAVSGKNKNPQFNYKTEIILNSIGIGVSVVVWLAGILLLFGA